MSELTPQATPLKLASHINYNPDVLTCLANLSNDEVFTPPELANQMLDMLPADLWTNKNAKFLDPVTKSGVFLREIVKRLTTGLAQEIPDLQTRINHICTQQVHGIAITELTSLLARRSVYCAKTANSDLSICSAFGDVQGNIRFERTQHTWKDGKCTYCGASEAVYSRDEALETHAYSFIHMSEAEIERVKNMKFDVIIGNPPYQLNTGGSGVQATPLYNKFVLQAKKLNPRHLVMIIPSRWFSGGFGLDTFRDELLNDRRLRVLHDFPEAADAFSGVQIKGGVCYFLWDRDNKGDCAVVTHRGDQLGQAVVRPLLERGSNTFIRYNEAISILHKIWYQPSTTMSEMVSSQKPFGFSTTYLGNLKKTEINNVIVYGSKGIGYCSIDDVVTNKQLISSYKVFIPRAGSGSDKFPHSILGKPFTPNALSACTETYVVIGPFDTQIECENIKSYIATRFFRFFVMLMKPTQDALRKVYSLVPIQDFSEPWTDEKLYAKYGLNLDEIAFIESMIRPMDVQTAEG